MYNNKLTLTHLIKTATEMEMFSNVYYTQHRTNEYSKLPGRCLNFLTLAVILKVTRS